MSIQNKLVHPLDHSTLNRKTSVHCTKEHSRHLLSCKYSNGFHLFIYLDCSPLGEIVLLRGSDG